MASEEKHDGRQDALSTVLGQGSGRDAEGHLADTGGIELPTGSQIPDSPRDCLVDRVRGEGTRRRPGEGHTGVAGGSGTRDSERSGGGIRCAARGGDEEVKGTLDCKLGTQGPVLVPGTGSHAREWVGKRLGLLPGPDSSSRSAVHLAASEGFARSPDLRAERRRANELDSGE